MPPSRPQQQLKAQVVRTSELLSGALKQLISNAPGEEKLSTIFKCANIYQAIYSSPCSTTCLQLYLDFGVPAKLWAMVVCQLELLATDDLYFQGVVTASLDACFKAMLCMDRIMAQNSLKAALWKQMLPVAGDEPLGKTIALHVGTMDDDFTKMLVM